MPFVRCIHASLARKTIVSVVNNGVPTVALFLRIFYARIVVRSMAGRKALDEWQCERSMDGHFVQSSSTSLQFWHDRGQRRNTSTGSEHTELP